MCRVPQQPQSCVCVTKLFIQSFDFSFFNSHFNCLFNDTATLWERAHHQSEVLPTENTCHTFLHHSFAFCDQLWSKYQWDHSFFSLSIFLSVVSLQAVIEFRSMQTKCRHRTLTTNHYGWTRALQFTFSEWLINQSFLFMKYSNQNVDTLWPLLLQNICTEWIMQGDGGKMKYIYWTVDTWRNGSSHWCKHIYYIWPVVACRSTQKLMRLFSWFDHR